MRTADLFWHKTVSEILFDLLLYILLALFIDLFCILIEKKNKKYTREQKVSDYFDVEITTENKDKDFDFCVIPEIKANEIQSNLYKALNNTLLQPFENGFSCYWYPLRKIKENIPAVYFLDESLDEQLSVLKEIFVKHNINKAIVHNNDNEESYYINGFPKFIYDETINEDNVSLWMSEFYFFDDSQTWLIYCSHEGTITFAGKWLVKEIKKNMTGYME